jgi:hypothetical protein
VAFIALICFLVCIINRCKRGGSDIYEGASFNTDTREEIIVEETTVVTHHAPGQNLPYQTVAPPDMGGYAAPGYPAPGYQPVSQGYPVAQPVYQY